MALTHAPINKPDRRPRWPVLRSFFATDWVIKHPNPVALFISLLLPQIILITLFKVMELGKLDQDPGFFGWLNIACMELGIHAALFVLLLATLYFARTPLTWAIHATFWLCFSLWNILAACGIFVATSLIQYEVDAFMYGRFFGPKILIEMIQVMGWFPPALFLAPYLALLTLPLFWLRFRRRSAVTWRISQMKVASVALIAMLGAVVSPTVEFAGDTRPHLRRLLFPQVRPSDFALDIESRPFLQPALLDSPVESRYRHVAFIILESTGALATTVHNPSLPSTPFLAAMAEKSLVTERAYVAVPHTSKALIAMMCGIFPYPYMEVVEKAPENLPTECLPKLLGDRGFETIFFSAATREFEHREAVVNALGFTDFRPFDTMPRSGFERVNYFGFEDNIVLDPAAEWLQKRRGKTTFAVYLTNTTHHPYTIPSHVDKIDFETSSLQKQLPQCGEIFRSVRSPPCATIPGAGHLRPNAICGDWRPWRGRWRVSSCARARWRAL